jgi:hypothetical protein
VLGARQIRPVDAGDRDQPEREARVIVGTMS